MTASSADQPFAIRCRKPACAVSSTGVCAEAHEPPESCPFAAPDKQEPSEVEFAELEEGKPEEDDWRIPLPSGEALDLIGVDELLRWRPINLVTIIGELGSGKTTLICSIYDRLLRGSFADYAFAESRTLIGFERKWHDARVDSGRTMPDTPRTSRQEGLRFFHIALLPCDRTNARRDLVLSDRAGEIYRQARSRSDLVHDLLEVTRADTVVLLLDGARIAEHAERAGAIQAVRQALRAFLDGGVLGPRSRVQIVTTKIDLWTAKSESERQEIGTVVSDFRHRLQRDFAQRLGDLSFFEVAARDPTGQLAPAYGVDRLLRSWLDVVANHATPAAPQLPALRSEFDRLLLRTPMDIVP